ncbi:TonB family protein [Pleionea sp. CnH1-48]|uniref:TonB family protein n=1 Tax=Pleionea sp. CnH1-48 TaxID=2954494 RepID=UPI0020969FC7|nr:TonB family protein [Pleionea sp. CnH1-48]MCO7224530.1 TonB family protein [Pleionea sp. CnH1-48]
MKRVAISLICLMSSSLVLADFSSAIKAYSKEQYKDAFGEFSQLAELGERRSQLNVGIMYFHGEGTTKDLLKSYAWARLAVEQKGSKEQDKHMLNAIEAELGNKRKAAIAYYKELAKSYSQKALKSQLYPDIDNNSYLLQVAHMIEPEYPSRAKESNISGKVKVRFDLDRKGNVRNFRLLESAPRKTFDESVIESFPKWRFKPYKNANGEPVYSYDHEFTVHFGNGSQPSSGNLSYGRIEKRAKKGDAKSQLKYGRYHKANTYPDVKVNPTEWFFKAAVLGNADAQYELGRSLLWGVGCKVDVAKGMRWLELAAQQQVPEAHELLAALWTNEETRQMHLQAYSSLSSVGKLSLHGQLRMARLLAISPYEGVSNPSQAIDMLEDISDDNFLGNVTINELIALAWARQNDFSEAVDFQEDALEAAIEMGMNTQDIQLLLERYRQVAE